MEQKKGIITTISVQRQSQSRCSIFVDNQFYIGCSIDTVAKLQLKKGMPLTTDVANFLVLENKRSEIKQKALSYATYKPRTVGQVKKALKTKGFTEEEIDYAVDFLKEFDYLNDKKYAYTFVKEFSERKKYGATRLRSELLKRFIGKEIIDEVLSEFMHKTDIGNLCHVAAEKKLRTLHYKAPEKQKASVVAYLQRQGFAWQEIKKCLEELDIK